MENQDNKQQQQTEGSVSIPREYVLEGIGQSVKEMHRMLTEAKKKYGASYNTKNEYEVCLRRYNLDDYEATLKDVYGDAVDPDNLVVEGGVVE